MSAQSGLHGTKPGVGFPLAKNSSKLASLPNSAPRPQAGGGGFLASESHGLATKIYLATGLLLETSALSDWQRAI